MVHLNFFHVYHLKIYTFMFHKMKKKSKLIFWTVWLVFLHWVTYKLMISQPHCCSTLQETAVVWSQPKMQAITFIWGNLSHSQLLAIYTHHWHSCRTYSTCAVHAQRYGTRSCYTLVLTLQYTLVLVARKTQENGMVGHKKNISRVGRNKNTKHVNFDHLKVKT